MSDKTGYTMVDPNSNIKMTLTGDAYSVTALDSFDLLTLAEVARLLHCSKAQVGRIVAGCVAGCERLPSVRLGRRKLVRKEALRVWIERSEAGDSIPPLPERDAGFCA